MASSRNTKLIDALPEPLLAILVNGLGAFYRANRYSRGMRSTMAEWRKLERLNLQEVQAYQLGRLRHIVHIANTTPYYSKIFRDVGLDPKNISSLDDLKSLPYLSKADLIEHGADMVVPGYEASRIERHSSGTTGQPSRFYQPHRMVYEQGFAMLYQFYSWFGFSPLRKRATLAGRYMGHKPRGVVMRNYFENQLLLGVHSLSERCAERYIRALDRFEPDMLQAHPSALLLLKQVAEAAGKAAPNIPLVSYTGETMTEDERDRLSKWMGGAMIFGTYGSGENVIASSECPELDGYHIHPAIGICELEEIDGKKEIIGTSLLNDAMPMLRYRMGDLAEELTTETCACGLSWPRLKGIQGRVDDHLIAVDGSPIAPVVIRTGVSALGALTAPYSIVQHLKTGTFTLLIYDDPSEILQAHVDIVLNYLRGVLGETADIGIKYLPREEMLTARAKHRTVIKEKVAKP